MQRKSTAYLWDMRNAADYIQAKTASMTFEQFMDDVDVRTIVERQLEIIGGAG